MSGVPCSDWSCSDPLEWSNQQSICPTRGKCIIKLIAVHYSARQAGPVGASMLRMNKFASPRCRFQCSVVITGECWGPWPALGFQFCNSLVGLPGNIS